MSEESSDSEGKLKFEKASETGKRNPPMFVNRDEGLTAWLDKDKNGNYFLRLRLPLGLGNIPIFLNDTVYSGIQKNFDKLVEHHLDQQDGGS